MNNNEAITRIKLFVDRIPEENRERATTKFAHAIPEGFDEDLEASAMLLFDIVAYWHIKGEDVMKEVTKLIPQVEADGRGRTRD